MPSNTIRIDNVPGQNIVFKNFRGRPTPVTREGDRNFCLIVFSDLIRRQLVARGCNLKKLKDGTEFVKVAVRIPPTGSGLWKDDIWTVLDMNYIDIAALEFSFVDYNINGKMGAKLYLRNARFRVKVSELNKYYIIDINYPNNVTCTEEETKMEKMTRAEVMGQLQMGITAFEMDKNTKKDPIVSKLVIAMKDAIDYIGYDSHVPEVSVSTRGVCHISDEADAIKSETKVKTVTVKEKVHTLPEIKQVIFNYPATVVIWSDGAKTVVECQKGDDYDMEKGLALCICKRMMGNQSNFNKQIRKYTNNTKNVQTKKKVKEGTFEERKAVRIAQAKANKAVNGKSKSRKGRSSPAVVNTDKMIVITESYVECVRKKMTARDLDYKHAADLAGISQAALSRWVSPNVKSKKPKRIKRECFNKLNKALGIRWKIEEV